MAFKFNFMSTIGGIAGGYASTFVEDWLKDDTSTEPSYTPVIVEAVAGSAISAFVKNDLVKGIGSGMVGVAGYTLGKMMSSSSSASASGLGALLPSQNAIGRVFRKRKSSVGEVEDSKKASNVA